MSFIYAEKTNYEVSYIPQTIRIYGDTRIELTTYSGAAFSENEKVLISKYGIVKSTIICPEFCISYAGNNIAYACKLFEQLREKHSFDVYDVIQMALAVHKSAKDPNDIEFIITSFERSLRLDCIKDNHVDEDCNSAWIGSYTAFREFQKHRIELKQDASIAFQQVVEGCSDDAVGGFPIGVQYNHCKKSFEYLETTAFFSSKPAEVYPGEALPFYMNIKDGGFSYSIISPSIDCVLFSIDQMRKAILFSRSHRYDQKSAEYFEGLMLPMVIEENGEGGWKRVK